MNKNKETPKSYRCLIEELHTKDGNTQIYPCFYAQLGALNVSACWEATQFYFSFLLFGYVQEEIIHIACVQMWFCVLISVCAKQNLWEDLGEVFMIML